MRILLIEDSVRIQESLRIGFRRAGHALDVVGEGDKGLVFACREHYDVIILDLMLPGMDGLEILRQLRERESDTHVLILSARSTVEERVEGLKLGADDYLPKPFSFDELLARVEALVRRRYQRKSPEIQIGDLTIDTGNRSVACGDQVLNLTKRDYSILLYLARRQGQTVSRIEIEDHVYGEENLPNSNTIESAISSIRRRLREVESAALPLLKTRHGMGYCLEGELS